MLYFYLSRCPEFDTAHRKASSREMSCVVNNAALSVGAFIKKTLGTSAGSADPQLLPMKVLKKIQLSVPWLIGVYEVHVK